MYQFVKNWLHADMKWGQWHRGYQSWRSSYMNWHQEIWILFKKHLMNSASQPLLGKGAFSTGVKFSPSRWKHIAECLKYIHVKFEVIIVLLVAWYANIGRLVMIWKVVLFGGMYEHTNDLWFASFVYESRTSAIDNLFCKDSVEDILAALVCTLKFIYWYPHYYFLLHSGFRESPIFCGFLSFYLQCLQSLQSTEIQYMVA